MAEKIRIVKNEVVTYNPDDADQEYYADEKADTIEKKAILDKEGVKDGTFDMADITSIEDLDITYTVEIVNEETGEVWVVDDDNTRHLKEGPSGTVDASATATPRSSSITFVGDDSEALQDYGIPLEANSSYKFK